MPTSSPARSKPLYGFAPIEVMIVRRKDGFNQATVFLTEDPSIPFHPIVLPESSFVSSGATTRRDG
jgi:hypothetical protein